MAGPWLTNPESLPACYLDDMMRLLHRESRHHRRYDQRARHEP